MTRTSTLAYEQATTKKTLIVQLISLGIGIGTAYLLIKAMFSFVAVLGIKATGTVATIALYALSVVIVYYSTTKSMEYIAKPVLNHTIFYDGDECKLIFISSDGEIKEFNISKYIPNKLKQKKDEK